MPSISSRIEKLEAQIAIVSSSSLADLLEAARKRFERGEASSAPHLDTATRPAGPKGQMLWDQLQAAKARVRDYRPVTVSDVSQRQAPEAEIEAEIEASIAEIRARRGW